MKLNIESKPMAELKPAEYNPRKIAPEAMKGLRASVDRFGLVEPIVWNKRTGNIVGGHQRYAVLKRKKVKEVDVVVVDLAVEDEKALNVTLNNPQIAGVFDDGLAALLTGLRDYDAGMFADLRLDELLGEGKKDIGAEDEVPPVPKKAITRTGDRIELGRHVLVCGDFRKNAFDTAGMILADPPYGVNLDTQWAGNRDGAAKNKNWRPVAGDDIAFDPRPLLNRPAIIWGANYFSDSLPSSSSWFVWDKREGVKSDLNADCELAWSNLGGPARVFAHLWKGTIRRSEKDPRVHPTQKPIALMAWCLERRPDGVGVIWDPFMGSGTVLMACERMGLSCVGTEIDPLYADVIVARWEAETGLKAARPRQPARRPAKTKNAAPTRP